MEIQGRVAAERFRLTLALLLEKTRSDAVSWQHVAGRWGNEFVAEFPSESIALRSVSPQAEPDFYSAELRTEHDGAELVLRASEGDSDWDLLSGLYGEAERSAIGWDRALAEIDRVLQEGKQVHAAPASPDRSTEIDPDDIPF